MREEIYRKSFLNWTNLPIKPLFEVGEQVVQNIIDETPVEDLLKILKILKRKRSSNSLPNGNYEVYFTEYDLNLADERNRAGKEN